MITKNIKFKDTEEEHIVYLDNDKLFHREDGPAVEYVKVYYKAWFKHGIRHREDGPAIENKVDDNNSSFAFIYEYGDHYFLNGKYYLELQYWSTVKFGGFV